MVPKRKKSLVCRLKRGCMHGFLHQLIQTRTTPNLIELHEPRVRVPRANLLYDRAFGPDRRSCSDLRFVGKHGRDLL